MAPGSSAAPGPEHAGNAAGFFHDGDNRVVSQADIKPTSSRAAAGRFDGYLLQSSLSISPRSEGAPRASSDDQHAAADIE